MLTLYQFEISPFCDKIRRILNRKRIPYRIHEVGLLEAQTSYRRKNPTSKCPAIKDDGRFVSDSTDIAYWIEERWPDPPLLPADPRERALEIERRPALVTWMNRVDRATRPAEDRPASASA